MSYPSYRFTVAPLCLAIGLALSPATLAATQANTATTLDAIQVTAADASAQARERLRRLPGASNVIDVASTPRRLASSADVLAYQPGISAASRAMKAPRSRSVARASTAAPAHMARASRCRSTACR